MRWILIPAASGWTAAGRGEPGRGEPALGEPGRGEPGLGEPGAGRHDGPGCGWAGSGSGFSESMAV